MLGFVGRMFGNGDGKSKSASGRRGRGRGKSVRERKELRRLKFLEELEEKDPTTYRAMMLKECGLAGDDGKIDMALVMKVIEYLKQIGLKVVPSKGGTDLDDDSLKSWIRDLAPMFAPMLAGAMGARTPTPPEVATAPEPTYRVVHAEPQPAAQPQPTQPEAAPTMSIVSRVMIGQLDGKSPAEAATWLLAQPQAAGLVDRLKDTPDVQILNVFAALAQDAPDFIGLVAWLKARPEWTIQTVHEIRAQSGGASPSTGAMGI